LYAALPASISPLSMAALAAVTCTPANTGAAWLLAEAGLKKHRAGLIDGQVVGGGVDGGRSQQHGGDPRRNGNFFRGIMP